MSAETAASHGSLTYACCVFYMCRQLCSSFFFASVVPFRAIACFDHASLRLASLFQVRVVCLQVLLSLWDTLRDGITRQQQVLGVRDFSEYFCRAPLRSCGILTVSAEIGCSPASTGRAACHNSAALHMAGVLTHPLLSAGWR